jgi:hypothetical protein
VSSDLIREIGEITRLAIDVPRAELLGYHRRKAELLTAIAEHDDDPDAREVAANAWQQVAGIEAAQ